MPLLRREVDPAPRQRLHRGSFAYWDLISHSCCLVFLLPFEVTFSRKFQFAYLFSAYGDPKMHAGKTPVSFFKWWARPFQVTYANRVVWVLAGSSLARARAAMPFGCLTLGEKKDYNSPSEVTDKYDLGQVVKSWVHPHWNANVWLNKGIKTRSSLFWQRGILWDIPGQR